MHIEKHPHEERSVDSFQNPREETYRVEIAVQTCLLKVLQFVWERSQKILRCLAWNQRILLHTQLPLTSPDQGVGQRSSDLVGEREKRAKKATKRQFMVKLVLRFLALRQRRRGRQPWDILRYDRRRENARCWCSLSQGKDQFRSDIRCQRTLSAPCETKHEE